MAYIDQIKKKQIAAAIKPICAKYGVKATLSIDNHSSLALNVKSGTIDFIGNSNKVCSDDFYQVAQGFTPNTKKYDRVNPYHYQSHYDGEAVAFLSEVLQAMNVGNHNRSDIQSDYFDVGWYVNVNIGKWDKPYELVA
jgi:MarR-like DNA-binding transcriptional regulator SgrR of sgrS sRNA